MGYKPVFKCNPAYKQQFKNSDCVLTISVGQKSHEGEKFAATIALINASFRSCTLLVSDTLQRYTMAIGDRQEDADFFYEQALKEGDEWLVRNKKYYGQLDMLKGIVRWDTLLKAPCYHEEKNKIRLSAQNDPEYRKSFEDTIDQFLARYDQHLNENIDFDEKRARRLCFDYLLEECAILSLLVELNCRFDVYPSQRVLAMEETHKRFVLPSHPTLLHQVALKFKGRSTIKSPLILLSV
jgi:tRNA-dependent cyclodipeptide synthase